MIKHFRIITKIYSYKQAGQMKILKLFLKIVYEDPARFFFLNQPFVTTGINKYM